MIGPGLKSIVRVTVSPDTRSTVVPTPVVPASPLGTTELAPMRANLPGAKPSELTARFSRFMKGVVIVTGAASALVDASTRTPATFAVNHR